MTDAGQGLVNIEGRRWHLGNWGESCPLLSSHSGSDSNGSSFVLLKRKNLFVWIGGWKPVQCPINLSSRRIVLIYLWLIIFMKRWESVLVSFASYLISRFSRISEDVE